jgi:predicted MFS family arabinose efflux permease
VHDDTELRWDRLTVACVLSYCLLPTGLNVGAILGELRDDLALSGLVAALHGATFGIGLLVLGLLGLPIVNRLGRRRSLLAVPILMTGGVTVFVLGDAWPVTFAGILLSGIAGALLVVVMPGLVADHHGPQRTAAFAAINAIPGLVAVACSLVLAWSISSTGSWRTTYLVATVLVATLALVALHGAPVIEGRALAPSSLPLLRRPQLRIEWVTLVLGVVVEFIVVIWAVAYLRDVAGASGGVATSLGALFGVCLFGVRMTLRHYVRLTGPWATSIAFATSAAGAVVMWAGPGLAVRVIGLVVLAAGICPVYPLCIERLTVEAHDDVTALGAVAALGSGVGVTVGPLLAGGISDLVGLRHAILAVPVVALIGALRTRPATSALSEASRRTELRR